MARIRGMGLDVATVSGIAVESPDPGRPICMTFRVREGDDGSRLEHFEEWLCDQIEAHTPDVVAWEAPLIPHGNALLTRAQTVLLLVQLAGVVALFATRYGCRRMPLNVARVKKFWTGHGRAEKADMIARCEQLGWSVRSDHEADAAAVWALAKSTVDPAWSPTATPLFSPGRRSA